MSALRLGFAAICVLAAACRLPHPMSERSYASDVRGAIVRLGLDGRPPIEGELLALADPGYWLLASERVTLVPYPLVRHAEFRTHDGRNLDAYGDSAAQRRSARFRYGISPEVMARLLTHAKQPAPDTIRAARP